MSEQVVDRDDLLRVAWALLMAAILLRDVTGAMPPAALVSMPPDIRNRMCASYYQDAFERLPTDVQDEARVLVFADPDVQNARAIHAEHNLDGS